MLDCVCDLVSPGKGTEYTLSFLVFQTLDINIKCRHVSILAWSLLRYNWVLKLFDRSVIENWFPRASRSRVIRTSFRYLSDSMKTWVTAELLSLLLGIPDVPANILGPNYCTDWHCLRFTLLLPENWLSEVVTCETGSLLVCQILCLLWSPKIRYSVQRNLPQDPILWALNQVCTLRPCRKLLRSLHIYTQAFQVASSLQAFVL